MNKLKPHLANFLWYFVCGMGGAYLYAVLMDKTFNLGQSIAIALGASVVGVFIQQRRQ